MEKTKNSVPEKVPVSCFNIWNYRVKMVFTHTYEKRSQLLKMDIVGHV